MDEALKASGGWMSQAAKMLGVNTSTVSRRVAKSQRLQQTITDMKALYLDIAESELLKKLKNGDLGAICFYLKCQGKERGYIEKVYHGTESNKAIEIIVKDACKSDT